jgi:hypothetical protein
MIAIPRTANAYSIFFVTHDPTTLAQANADSLPTVAMRYTDGATQGTLTNETELSWSVTNISTGLYRLTIDMTNASAPLSMGRVVTPIVTAVVGGVTGSFTLETFAVGAPRGYGSVVADAGNTATSFKATFSPAANTNDSLKRCWIAFISGALRGQVAKVSGYVAATDFVTVEGGFTAAPAAGDDFEVIYR